MGTVYRATDRLTQKIVALKRVTVPSRQLQFASQASLKNSVDFRLALAQEFKTLASLRHPHIISVLDHGFDENRQPFLTMEMLENALTLIEAGRGLPLAGQVELLVQVLQALAYLHRRGIIHRDLKPENVLVVNGQAKVLDFGLAVARKHLKDQSQDVVGTLAYIAPEVLEGDPASEAADLYAIGVMAYELFAGQHPFDIKDLAALMSDIIIKTPDVESLGLDDNLAGVLTKLLAKNPKQRYSDAHNLIKAYVQAANRLDLLAETIAIRESFLQAAQFVGRDSEFALLVNALKAAQAGLDSAWLIGGESGVGKTRLLDELRTQALAEGILVLRGQAVSNGAAPYQLWRNVLRRLCLESDLSDIEAGVLKALVPDIATLLEQDVPDAPALDPHITYERLLTVIEGIFRRQPQPLVVILEDLHWAGAESLAVLNRLSRSAGKEPLMLIASYRDDERPNLPNELPGIRLLKLPRLSVDSITALSESMLGDAGRDPKIINLLQQETEGNTLFIVEVVRALAEESGQLANVSSTSLPRKIYAGGIQDIIKRRLKQVPDNLYPLLRVAATAGRELNLKVLETAAIQMSLDEAAIDNASTADSALTTSPKRPSTLTPGASFGGSATLTNSKKTRPLSMSLPDLDRWLNRCAEAMVLEVGEGRWRFAHDKLRQGLLADVSNDEQKHLHRQVAEAIERAYPKVNEYAAALAHHWTEVGEATKAAQYSGLAGEQAVKNGALDEAVTWLKRAIELHEQAETSSFQKARLHRLLAEAYYGLGQPVESRRHLHHTLTYLGWPMPAKIGALISGLVKEGARHIWGLVWATRLSPRQHAPPSPRRADLLEAVRAYERLAQIYYVANQTVPALYATLHGFNLAQSAGPSPELARFYATMVGVYRYAHLHRLAEGSYRRAVEIARELNDPAVLAWLRFAVSILSVGFHPWTKLQAALEEAVALFNQLGNKRSGGDSLVTLSYVFYFQGQFKKGAKTAADLYQLGLESDNLEHQAWGLTDQARSLVRLGQTDQAVALLEQVSPLLATIEQSRIADIQTYGLQAIVCLRQGQIEAARQAAETTAHLLGQSPPIAYSLFEGYASVPEVYLTLWEEAITNPANNPQSTIHNLKSNAGHACQALHKYAAQFPIGQPRAWLYQGWFSWLSGRQNRARKQWRKSLTHAQKLAMPYEEGLAHYEIGRHLSPDDTATLTARQEHLTRAIEIFERLEAVYDLERAQALVN